MPNPFRGPGLTDIADSKAIVRHLTIQIEALTQENQELRASAKSFGDLAERLSDQLRKDRSNRGRQILPPSTGKARRVARVPGQPSLFL